MNVPEEFAGHESERRELALLAAGQIERLWISLIEQSTVDNAGANPKPLPAPIIFELAHRGRDLAITILSALDDDVVTTDELRSVVNRP